MAHKFPHNFAIKGNRDWVVAKNINEIFVSLGIEPVPHPYDKYTAPALYYYIGEDNKVYEDERYDKEIMDRIVLCQPSEYYELVRRNLL